MDRVGGSRIDSLPLLRPIMAWVAMVVVVVVVNTDMVDMVMGAVGMDTMVHRVATRALEEE